MSREDAIEIFKDWIDEGLEYDDGYAARDLYEDEEQAVIMAIKALSQEPCDDAVSRQAAIDAIKKIHPVDTEYDCTLYDKLDVMYVLKELPPVTPQQKYGKWIEHPEIETSAPEYLMFYECSECGNKPCFCKSDIHKKRFCSNCGCRMVEPQERSDKE